MPHYSQTNYIYVQKRINLVLLMISLCGFLVCEDNRRADFTNDWLIDSKLCLKVLSPTQPINAYEMLKTSMILNNNLKVFARQHSSERKCHVFKEMCNSTN